MAYVGKTPQPKFLGQVDDLTVADDATVAGDLTVTGNVDVDGTIEFDALSGTGTVAVTNILDEDNMASNSATALSTQQSIKAYVDSQVGTADTLPEVLALGNTTGGTDIVVSVDDVISMDNGTNSLPSLTTTGDLNTGLYFPAADQVGLTVGGTQRLNVSATGIDVTGTVTADGLTVDGASLTVDNGFGITSIGAVKYIADSDDNAPSTGLLHQFYTDNGTTAALVVQKSGYVGIGTTPGYTLDVEHATDNGIARFTSGDADVFIVLADSGTTGAGNRIGAISNDMYFKTASTTRMTIDSSGKLLIGNSTSQTTDLLQVESPASGGGHGIAIRRNDANADQQLGRIMFGNTADSDIGQIHVKTTGATNTGAMVFSTASAGTTTDRMTIDSSGNVGIGTVSPSSLLHLKSTATGLTPTIILENTNNAQNMNIDYWSNAGAVQSRINYNEGAGSWSFIPNTTSGNQALNISYGGAIGIGTDSGTAPLTVHGGSATAATIQLKGGAIGNDNASIHSLYNLYLKADSSEAIANRNMIFQVGSTEAMRITSTGLVTVKENLYMESSGIFLGGSGGGNYLDDYEESTYNTVLTGATSGTVTTANSGTMTKIGRAVSITFASDGLQASQVSGNLGIALPVISVAQSFYVPIQVYNANYITDAKTIYGFVASNTSQILLYWSRDNNTSSPVTGAHLNTTSYIRGAFTYPTT